MNEKPNTNVNLIATSIALKKLKKNKTKQMKFTWKFRMPLKNEGIKLVFLSHFFALKVRLIQERILSGIPFILSC